MAYRRLAERCGDPALRIESLAWYAVALAFLGLTATSARVDATARHLAKRVQSREHRVPLELLRSGCLVLRGEFDEAFAELARSFEHARASGDRFLIGFSTSLRGWWHGLWGRFDRRAIWTAARGQAAVWRGPRRTREPGPEWLGSSSADAPTVYLREIPAERHIARLVALRGIRTIFAAKVLALRILVHLARWIPRGSVIFALSLCACRVDSRDSEPATKRISIGREDPRAPEPGKLEQQNTHSKDLDHAQFRARVVDFVRSVSIGQSGACPLPSLTTPLQVAVSVYVEGKRVGWGRSGEDEICAALREATTKALAMARLPRASLGRARFVVDLPNHDMSIVEFAGAGVELVTGQVAVRTLDAAMIRQSIDEGSAYLLRMLDPQRDGVHKYYRATTDSFEDRLHAIYTASTIYTLIMLHAHNHDERLRRAIDRAAGFLLEMQRIAPGQPGHGAFHYSMDVRSGRREPLFVVGTTSKSIFALIELHSLTKDPKYLAAARLAGDWLMTMQRLDGSVVSKLKVDAGGELVEVEQDSTLYTGQVLSALSRLHVATSDPRYLEAAARTAGYLRQKQAEQGCYVGDEYREPNPVSSSWLIMSLLDYAKASHDATAHATAVTCADELLERQIDAPDDVERHGRWSGSLSSSGNGWLAEVLSILYLDCEARDAAGCVKYRDAVIGLFRVLRQHTYTPESTFAVENPAMAMGGLFWSPPDRDVRTDSVCHALNAYVFMVDHLPEGKLVELPEPPLQAILAP